MSVSISAADAYVHTGNSLSLESPQLAYVYFLYTELRLNDEAMTAY